MSSRVVAALATSCDWSIKETHVRATGAFLPNNTEMPTDFNYMTGATTRTINGQQYVESTRLGVRATTAFLGPS